MTGMVLNNVNQQIVLLLRVEPPGEAPFQYERKMFVPFHGMPRAGDLIDVAYDPSDKSRVALQFDPRSDTGGGQLLLTRRQGEGALPAGMQASSAPAAPASPEPAAVSTAPGRVIESLERLQRLKENGALTETEFEVQKAKLLSGQDV